MLDNREVTFPRPLTLPLEGYRVAANTQAHRCQERAAEP